MTVLMVDTMNTLATDVVGNDSEGLSFSNEWTNACRLKSLGEQMALFEDVRRPYPSTYIHGICL